MKRSIKLFSVAFVASIMLTSCFSYTSVVGKGAQGTTKVTKWNHYVLGGLAPVDVSDSKEMAGGAENYTVFTRQSFVNGLIAAITFSIYTPTTTTVTK
ncbi:Bor family protein [Flavobacterium sp. SUN046]|uniref:Bor family protein n=1 Tax=Flavobacterium sp. SUN046 TaxID=3002440 RepID=UPI002DBA1678|nr:Bor family protein [Flavobacterium sp. SUN046]MEC4050032.1 Bor family protein [Flavobacterium sp. SUN046]